MIAVGGNGIAELVEGLREIAWQRDHLVVAIREPDNLYVLSIDVQELRAGHTQIRGDRPFVYANQLQNELSQSLASLCSSATCAGSVRRPPPRSARGARRVWIRGPVSDPEK